MWEEKERVARVARRPLRTETPQHRSPSVAVRATAGSQSAVVPKTVEIPSAVVPKAVEIPSAVGPTTVEIPSAAVTKTKMVETQWVAVRAGRTEGHPWAAVLRTTAMSQDV